MVSLKLIEKLQDLRVKLCSSLVIAILELYIIRHRRQFQYYKHKYPMVCGTFFLSLSLVDGVMTISLFVVS